MNTLDVIRGAYEAFARGDIPAVLGALDPEIRWHEAESNPYMPSGEALVGPQTVLNELFVRLASEWDGFAVHPASFHDAGEHIVVEGRYSGKYRATGRDLDVQMCHVWTLANGKVTKFQQYVDTARLVDTMGAEF